MSQFSDPLNVVQALLAAENAHDVDAAVMLFDDTAIVNLAVEERRGKDEIRAWQQELADGNFKMRVVGDFEVSGNSVRFANRLDLDMFKELGVGTVEAESEAVVENGKITSYRFSLTPVSAERLQQAMNKSD